MAAKSKKSSNSSRKSSTAKKSTAKKSTAKKNAGNKGKNSSSKKVDTQRLEQNLKREALGWFVILLGVVTMISLFLPLGSLGKVWAGILKNGFGFCAYFFPLFFVYLILPLVLHESKGRDIRRAVSGCVLFVLLCNLFELFFQNGGSLGQALEGTMVSVIGFAGALVVTIILIVICAVVLTEKSALKGMQAGGGKAYSTAKRHGKQVYDTAKRRKLEQKERRERQAELTRMKEEKQSGNVKFREKAASHTVSTEPESNVLISDIRAKQKRSGVRRVGVTFDTTLRDENKNPEFKEIISDESEPIEFVSPEEMQKIPEAVAEDLKEMPKADPEETQEMPEAFDEELKDLSEVFAETGEQRAPLFARNEQQVPELSADDFDEISEENTAEETVTEKVTPSRKRRNQSVSEVQPSKMKEEIQPEMSATSEYRFPTLDMLSRGESGGGEAAGTLEKTKQKLEQTLQMFGVDATVESYSQGPTVTRFEVRPNMGVKVSKIVNLADDIKLNLAAADIRIEAPIPGKPAVGIEVPNKKTTAVHFGDLIASEEFQNSKSKLSFAVGKDLSGKAVVFDIAKMPHVLVAGATGSGKSVCINTLIMSILYKARPDEVKLIMVDPKVVELSVYNGIPHLLIPVVTDPKKAAGALNWAVLEMEKRYKTFAEFGVRDMKGYNQKVEDYNFNREDEDTAKLAKMYQLVVIVDELADLMMVASKEVEASICRLAQLARAAGIHLVIATQRPSVNVITGLIKANMPSRIAFSVTSGVDSRTIIDMNGAEKLLGKGDMLFFPTGLPKPIRVQGSFVSDSEVQRVVDFLKENKIEDEEEDISKGIQETMNSGTVPDSLGISSSQSATADTDSKYDAYFVEAGKLIVEKEKASIGMLQRAFKIGFNRAARIMDQLCEAGVVGGEEGTKPRKILMNADEYEEFIKNL